MDLVSRIDSRWFPRLELQSELSSLSVAFAAVDYFKEKVHQDATDAQLVLTRPGKASLLEEQLTESGWQIGHVEPTDQAFIGLVRRARSRVVIMTPFLDENGAAWLQELISQIAHGVRIVLILRSLEDATRPDYPKGLNLIRDCLFARGVELHNYSIPRGVAGKRETFHAKLVLADADVAYVGSANITAASREYSMEMGVVLRGRAARSVGMVVDAVIRCVKGTGHAE